MDEYSKYILLEYRQRLMRILLAACMLVTAGITILNLIEWVLNPAIEWGIFNLASDLIALAIFLALWRLNQSGYVTLVGWIFCLTVTAYIPVSYSPPYITQALVIMFLPVAVSGLIIQPWTSFLFTGLAILVYTDIYLRAREIAEYDYFSILALCVLALIAHLVSSLLNKTISNLALAHDETIQGWAAALEIRDAETMGHSQRVVELTLSLAKKLGLRGAELFHLRRGVLLHDIGKIGVPDAILHKAGDLSEDEWEVMRKHPEFARDYLSKVSHLAQALELPYAHHEKWDGTGYPRGLKGEEIPLAARIFAVVDVWDALTSSRPYRKARSKEEALAYIQEQAGSHFDPVIAASFVELIKTQDPELNAAQ
ncbi:MAG: hypothetical protein A2Z03_03785 [Chloroflexi bacterium RBG_16_56_8]|nr:MAG: hypothetical protein A2Z03_03785 [Chloroflexi bacterium RBG_16_56_8]